MDDNEYLNRKRSIKHSETKEFFLKNTKNNEKDEFQSLKNQLKDINKQIQTNRQEIRLLNNQVYNLNYQNLKLQNQNKQLKEEINALKFDNLELRELIGELQIKNKTLEIQNKILEMKNETLEKKFKRQEREILSLSRFVFKAKLRKILKKLLQYIVKTYFYKYMKYNPSNKKVYFDNSPLIYGINKYDVKKAMNQMLEIIFTSVKQNNFVIHFVDEEAMKNESAKKDIEVFYDPKDFFYNILIFQNHKK